LKHYESPVYLFNSFTLYLYIKHKHTGLRNIFSGAEATYTVNAVTSSAIYRCVEHKDQHIDFNGTVFIKYVSNGNIYEVPIYHGNYLFFEKSDTEYKLYYEGSNGFNLLETINASDLTAGNSYEYNIPYSDIDE
jgi:hypothetical protein